MNYICLVVMVMVQIYYKTQNDLLLIFANLLCIKIIKSENPKIKKLNNLFIDNYYSKSN